MSQSITNREVPKAAVVTAAILAALLLFGGIWWMTGTHNRENAYSAVTTNRESTEQFRQEMTSQQAHSNQPADGSIAAREANPEFRKELVNVR